MSNLVYVAVVVAFGTSLLLTFAMFRMALAHGLLDVPNERSSHKVPTPRGGGAAIVVACTGVLTLFVSLHSVTPELGLALIGGGLTVAAIGFIDDRRSVRALVRLCVHLGAALWALAWIGGMKVLQVGSDALQLGWGGYLLGTLVIVWVLNLFNFMDGIDGIAASEALFIVGAGVALTATQGGPLDVVAAGLAFGAACAGFLLWNWPPAKIFMGDVGSGYLGYTIAVLAIASGAQHPAQVWVWFILGGVFFVDATVTLVRRVFRGEPVYVAHRSHGYQWLARRWGSHKRVTVTVMMVNLVWLLPCAICADLEPEYGAWITVLAFAPLVLAAWAVGSGRSEAP